MRGPVCCLGLPAAVGGGEEVPGPVVLAAVGEPEV
jgi:hypothetical protein